MLCFSLESPHQGDSHEYTQHSIVNIKKKLLTQSYPKYDNVCSYGIFVRDSRTSLRVQNSYGKRAISVRATEVLLYSHQHIYRVKISHTKAEIIFPMLYLYLR